MSVQAGANYTFGSNDLNVYRGVSALGSTVYWGLSTQSGIYAGYAFGMTPYSGFPVSSNAFSVGVDYNITHNTWSGNLSAWSVDQTGLTFNPSFSAMIFPEKTTNFFRGKGFNNNDQVLSQFVDAGDYQEALDYFGFEGTFDPDNEIFKRGNGQAAAAAVDSRTGEIFYNEGSYYSYAELAFTARHEQIHSQNVRSGKYEGVEIDYMVAGNEEWSTYLQNYKEYGLYPYPKGRNELISRINQYGLQAGIYEYVKTPTSFYSTLFTPRWWHVIYRIPRRW